MMSSRLSLGCYWYVNTRQHKVEIVKLFFDKRISFYFLLLDKISGSRSYVQIKNMVVPNLLIQKNDSEAITAWLDNLTNCKVMPCLNNSSRCRSIPLISHIYAYAYYKMLGFRINSSTVSSRNCRGYALLTYNGLMSPDNLLAQKLIISYKIPTYNQNIIIFIFKMKR